MATNTQFSIAVHVMAGLGCRGDQHTTSAQLAASVNTSPSFVRRVLAKLSKNGLVQTSTGKAGECRLARTPDQISLWEIYHAVDAPKTFAIHNYAVEGGCHVSCNIKAALEKVQDKTQKALEAALKKISLGEIVRDVTRK